MSPDRTPLCVDLDGTLLRTDTLVESLLVLLRERPWSLLKMPLWLLRGKAHFKHEVAQRVTLDAATLPQHEAFNEWLREQHRAGRPLVLVTAADQSIAQAVAAHTQLFGRVFASDGTVNLSRELKRARLVAEFGERGYDYAGDTRADLPVWRDAREAIVVSPSARLLARAQAEARVGKVFAGAPATLAQWPRALRMHQWVKNLLMFLPVLLAQKIGDPKILITTLGGFVAFCLCASSVYLLNDLLDLPSDRVHPRKRLRPFASGALPALDGLVLAPLLLAMAFFIAVEISWWFTLVLATYYVSTLAYSLYLKRIPLVDVLLLAGLYTLRMVAGGAAAGVSLTFWLLAFSMFLFLSLAMMKRYTELEMFKDRGGDKAAGRGYTSDDLPLLRSQGVSAGYGAVLVLALYINSPQSQVLYGHPHYLWLLCPLLLYWISRAWMKAHRGQMHDDPIVFALRDVTSIMIVLMMAAAVATAELL